MNNHIIYRVSLSVIILILILPVSVISADEPVVRAFLFFSPSCPHCHKVIAEDLPPITDRF